MKSDNNTSQRQPPQKNIDIPIKYHDMNLNLFLLSISKPYLGTENLMHR